MVAGACIGRPHYGYKGRGGVFLIDPPAAAVVVCVLAVRPSRRYGLAARFVRHLCPSLSIKAAGMLAERIRSHAADYRAGIPRKGFAPDRRLVIAGHAPASP